MTDGNKKDFQSGISEPAHRREGDIVPTPLPSSTCAGLAVADVRTPGTSAIMATGIDNEEEDRRQADKTGPRKPRITATEIIKKARKPGPKSSKITKEDEKKFTGVRASPLSPPPPGDDTETEEALTASESFDEASRPQTCSEPTSNESTTSVRTTASGASKRTRSSNEIRKRKNTRETDTYSSDDDNGEPQTPIRRMRGRPITTGEGVGIRARKEAERILANIEKKISSAEEIAQGGYDSKDFRGEQLTRKEEQLEEELRLLPSADISAKILEGTRQITDVAQRSGNLKGTFVKTLKEAAILTRLGVDALITRSKESSTTGSAEKMEMENLRAEVQALKEEVQKLRKERDEYLMPPPPLPGLTSANGNAPMREIEMIDEKVAPQISAAAILEQKKDWPLAIRPAVGGQRKILYDSDDEVVRTIPAKGNIKEKISKTAPVSIEKIVDAKLSVFSSFIQEEIRKMFLTFEKRFRTTPGKGIPNGARENAPKVQPPKGSTAVRPVPEEEQRLEKGKTQIKKTTRKPEKLQEDIPNLKRNTAQKTQTRMEQRNKPTYSAVTRGSEKELETGPSDTEYIWTTVYNRRTKRQVREQTQKNTAEQKPKAKVQQQQDKTNFRKQEEKRSRPPRRRVPRTAAVVLTCPVGSYASTMTEVRNKIKLSEVGITGGITTRTAATGALVIEVPGPENGPKADALASLMREALKNKEGIRIDRPTIMAEIRLWGIEPSITANEIREALAEDGKCRPHEVQIGELRATGRGQNSVWAKLPLIAAKKVTAEKGIVIGWTKIRTELLEARPLRCFKCLERGHVRDKCTNPTDRSNRCYRCGSTGHVARTCKNAPKCPICSDLGRKADHSMGGKQCAPQKRKGRTTDGMKDQPINQQQQDESLANQVSRMEIQPKETPLPQRQQRKLAKKEDKISVPNTSGPEPMEAEPLEEREQLTNNGETSPSPGEC